VILRSAAVVFWLGLTTLVLPARASGQEPEPEQEHEHERAQSEPASEWKWAADARVFFGFNYQDRRFTDFSVWESQNWVLGAGERSLGAARLQLTSMFSLEPLTMQDIGSPQAFQTGETYQQAALIDYQHPHDLIMALGAQLRIPARRTTVIVGMDAVGSPTLGPRPFMHRPSAEPNPQAPLSHHHLDATHSTPGVIRAGLEVSAFRVEGSVFRGREPDEDRFDVDFGALDSYAVRVWWFQGPWSAQASGGWLNEAEFVTPYDATRLTASISYDTERLAWTAAFGQNREIHGNLEAYLLEAAWRVRPRDTLYSRLESVAKDILDVGFHPVGTFHRHRQSQVGAVTFGYLRDVLSGRAGALGLGADLTAYAVPSNLREAYGSPLSFHAFVKYRLGPQGTHGH
jgi:hypothetical protein